jgi:hypothetical protein
VVKKLFNLKATLAPEVYAIVEKELMKEYDIIQVDSPNSRRD